MTTEDRLQLLRRAVEQHGQSEVARRISRSDATISQVMNDKYPGRTDRVLELIAAEFGNETVDCPIMGEIPLACCTEERSKPFRATNPQRRKLFVACRECERSKP